MDTMLSVREGMRVVGSDGKKIGTVEDLKIGDPDAVMADGQVDPETDGIASEGIRSFAGLSGLSNHDAERLQRIGYVKVKRSGIFAGHAFLGSDELDRVEDDTLWVKSGG
jgi:sporulation protein YlmC with PRC-barrel domain